MPSRCVPTWLWLSHVSSMYVSWFSPSAAPGASVVAVRIVLVNRLPKRGIPSVSGYDMTTTLPSWISAAAALVTAGVTRLVAPVWSFAPHGEGGTTLVQSVCARTAGAEAIRVTRMTATTSADLRVMRRTPFDGEGHDHIRAVTRRMVVPIPRRFKTLCDGAQAWC